MSNEQPETQEYADIWQRAHLQVERLRRVLAADEVDSSAEVEEALKVRAERLAAPVGDAEPTEDSSFCLLLKLADEEYAIECEYVRGVAPLPSLRRLPGTPAFVLGIVNWQGRFVAVLDLRGALGLAPTEHAVAPQIVLLGNADSEFGVLVDSILGTTSMRMDTLYPALKSAGANAVRHVLGITASREVVIDARSLLNEPSLRVGRTGS